MMRINFNIPVIILFSISLLISCESDKRIPPKGFFPNTPKATSQLEAAYFWIPQNQLKSAYWKEADYIEVTVSDLQKNLIYGDGYLNMTGTYGGKSSFNKGKDPKITIKAGYDNEFLYLLVEWKDTTINASMASWLWDGPTDIRKSDSSEGWTSQRNNDNLTLFFDNIENGKKEAWNWSIAKSAPFNSAFQLVTDDIIELPVAEGYTINNTGNTSRSGPAYEWDGSRQELYLPDSTKILLDPAYYLLDNHKMTFEGSAESGQNIFNGKADCRYCHGPNGNGEPDGETDGGSLRDVFTNRFSREALIEFISSDSHEGGGGQYWGNIQNNPVDIENLLAYLRSIAGVPGNILLVPDDEIAVKALSNIGFSAIADVNSTYKVLFIRKLKTGNVSEVQFDPSGTYNFSIRVSDNDELNNIGAIDLQLIFKSSEL